MLYDWLKQNDDHFFIRANELYFFVLNFNLLFYDCSLIEVPINSEQNWWTKYFCLYVHIQFWIRTNPSIIFLYPIFGQIDTDNT